MDPLTTLAAFLGGGGAMTILAYGLFRMTSSAIATAIEQRGKQEIEKYKADFARELERERQGAAKDLEAFKSQLVHTLEFERQFAARALETFKAELTLTAEVRRQVAARQVEAATGIVAAGQALLTKLGMVNPSDRSSQTALYAELANYSSVVNEKRHLFSREIAEKLNEYSLTILKAHHGWISGTDDQFIQRACNACEYFIDVMRVEMQVEKELAPRRPDPKPGDGVG